MIDARALHDWLGHRAQNFHKWVQSRIDDYGFVEGEDFSSTRKKTGGRPRTDYLLTLDMAKELAMVERSQIGRMTRAYFIEMEQGCGSGARDCKWCRLEGLEDYKRLKLNGRKLESVFGMPSCHRSQCACLNRGADMTTDTIQSLTPIAIPHAESPTIRVDISTLDTDQVGALVHILTDSLGLSDEHVLMNSAAVSHLFGASSAAAA